MKLQKLLVLIKASCCWSLLVQNSPMQTYGTSDISSFFFGQASIKAKLVGQMRSELRMCLTNKYSSRKHSSSKSET